MKTTKLENEVLKKDIDLTNEERKQHKDKITLESIQIEKEEARAR